jgi:hypothetical protein
VSRPAGSIHLPRCNAGKPYLRPFSAPDRTVPVPHSGRGAGESSARGNGLAAGRVRVEHNCKAGEQQDEDGANQKTILRCHKRARLPQVLLQRKVESRRSLERPQRVEGGHFEVQRGSAVAKRRLPAPSPRCPETITVFGRPIPGAAARNRSHVGVRHRPSQGFNDPSGSCATWRRLGNVACAVTSSGIVQRTRRRAWPLPPPFFVRSTGACNILGRWVQPDTIARGIAPQAS